MSEPGVAKIRETTSRSLRCTLDDLTAFLVAKTDKTWKRWAKKRKHLWREWLVKRLAIGEDLHKHFLGSWVADRGLGRPLLVQLRLGMHLLAEGVVLSRMACTGRNTQ